MIDKKLIKFSFSRFASIYKKEASIQEKASKDLIDFGEKEIKGIGLDLGSGTGYISKNLKDKDSYIINIDLSKSMLKESNIDYFPLIQGDIEKLPFKDNSFDFVISNFSLHWTNLNQSFNEVNRVLKRDRYFVFNIPIKGSLNFISYILNSNKFNFFSKEEILDILEKNGFETVNLKTVEYKMNFENGFNLLIHLHKTGVSLNPKDTNFREKRIIVNKFKNWKKNCYLNYKLLYVKAKKI